MLSSSKATAALIISADVFTVLCLLFCSKASLRVVNRWLILNIPETVDRSLIRKQARRCQPLVDSKQAHRCQPLFLGGASVIIARSKGLCVVSCGCDCGCVRRGNKLTKCKNLGIPLALLWLKTFSVANGNFPGFVFVFIRILLTNCHFASDFFEGSLLRCF